MVEQSWDGEWEETAATFPESAVCRGRASDCFTPTQSQHVYLCAGLGHPEGSSLATQLAATTCDLVPSLICF